MVSLSPLLKHRQIELDHVPTGQDVRIVMAYRFGQAEQKVFLVTAKDRDLRATGCSGRREEHLFHPRSMQCRCEER